MRISERITKVCNYSGSLFLPFRGLYGYLKFRWLLESIERFGISGCFCHGNLAMCLRGIRIA